MSTDWPEGGVDSMGEYEADRPKKGKTCQRCGAVFQKSRHCTRASWAERKYCTQTCSNRANGERQKAALAERFWSYVSKGDALRCWTWTGYKDPWGYGRLSVGGRGGKPRLAHRVSYELAHGPISADLHIRHKCDNPACVNPSHLEPGSHADNMADFGARGHGNRGENNGCSKLTAEQVAIVKLRLNAGERPAIIARDFPVTRTAIDRIKNKDGWRHV